MTRQIHSFNADYVRRQQSARHDSVGKTGNVEELKLVSCGTHSADDIWSLFMLPMGCYMLPPLGPHISPAKDGNVLARFSASLVEKLTLHHFWKSGCTTTMMILDFRGMWWFEVDVFCCLPSMFEFSRQWN